MTIPADQVRKGADTPYLGHLLSVAGLVLENGGDEDHAIYLKDIVKAGIRERFGDRVADIVLGCTDADTLPKPPWRERKERYIRHLDEASPETLLVSCADKLHNARAIVTDLGTHGNAVFARFNAGRAGTLWYYAELARAFERLLPGPLSRELVDTAAEMARRAAEEA